MGGAQKMKGHTTRSEPGGTMKERRRHLRAPVAEEPMIKVPSNEAWHSQAVEGWTEEVEAALGDAFTLFDLNQDKLLDRADHSFILSIAEEVCSPC